MNIEKKENKVDFDKVVLREYYDDVFLNSEKYTLNNEYILLNNDSPNKRRGKVNGLSNIEKV